MKKTYEKPTLVKAGNLPQFTAAYVDTGNGDRNGQGYFISLVNRGG